MPKPKKIPLAEGLIESRINGYGHYLLLKIPDYWGMTSERTREHYKRLSKALGFKITWKASHEKNPANT